MNHHWTILLKFVHWRSTCIFSKKQKNILCLKSKISFSRHEFPWPKMSLPEMSWLELLLKKHTKYFISGGYQTQGLEIWDPSRGVAYKVLDQLPQENGSTIGLINFQGPKWLNFFAWLIAWLIRAQFKFISKLPIQRNNNPNYS